MEIVITLFFLVGGSIAYSAWKKNKSSGSIQPVNDNNDLDKETSDRRCLSCGYEGQMKTWIANYTGPKLILIAGFLLGYIPGLIFLAVYWGKYKCQRCGAVGKNQLISDTQD
jgi:DNA-directed RNA polymerase subunit RPC12/RpoP